MSRAGPQTGAELTVLEDFDEPTLAGSSWDALLTGTADVPFLLYDWQREWWRAFGGDRLLLVLAGRADAPVAIAPLFALEEMLFLVGSGGSDYLDVLGEPDEATLAAMLDAARAQLPAFQGIGLYNVLLESRTTRILPGVADRLQLELYQEGEMGAPYMDLSKPEAEAHLWRRKVRKEDARMRRAGALRVRSAGSENLEEWLEVFFEQHAGVWHSAGVRGLEGEDARAFFGGIVRTGHRAGWLRLTMLEWRERPAAIEVTLIRRDRHVSYLASRDPAIREFSAGKVLQAHVATAALHEGARIFDLGLGEEEYKMREASGVRKVANWFLYP